MDDKTGDLLRQYNVVPPMIQKLIGEFTITSINELDQLMDSFAQSNKSTNHDSTNQQARTRNTESDRL